MNKWSEIFGIPYPECKKTGQCCECSSPSSPAIKILEKAANNDEFSRDFLNIFVPYKNIEEVKKLFPKILERNLEAIKKSDCGEVNENNIVFYKCRFLKQDKNCAIYEDRPTLCRDFPDSPFLVFAPGCAYENWGKNCKESYKAMMENKEVYKKALEDLRYQKKAIRTAKYLSRISNPDYKPVILLPSLSLVSPGASWIKIF